MSGWKKATAPDSRTYYYKPGTQETTWIKPEDFEESDDPPTGPANDAAADNAWKEAKAGDGKTYYYNSITKATSWEPPAAFLKNQQNARPAAPAFVAGGAPNFERDDHGVSDRRMDRMDRMDRRGGRDHGMQQRPGFDGGRGGWEQKQDAMGFRGAMPVKTDEPTFSRFEDAEEAYLKLLRKHSIPHTMPFEEALRLVVRERDYRALKDPYERRVAYQKYVEQARAEEAEKEQERRQKVREEFRRMLSTHDEIKPYTRWKTARPCIEHEAVFKSAGDDGERRHIFEEYVTELKNKDAEEKRRTRQHALSDLRGLLRALFSDPGTKWEDAQHSITNNDRFNSEEKFRSLTKLDLINAYDEHTKALYSVLNEQKQREKRLQSRRDRRARDAFRSLMQELRAQKKIGAVAKWRELLPLIADDPRYLNLIGTAGSSPMDIYRDTVEEQNQMLRPQRHRALDVLEARRFEMTPETQLSEFMELMHSDPKTAVTGDIEHGWIYDVLMAKVKRRAKEDKEHDERRERKAADRLQSFMKRVEPPITADERYEDVAPRLQKHMEFRALKDENKRRAAFDKHIRRLRDREEDDARDRERDRPRRDRDRDYRNGARRDYDRDRDHDRRHRTRTPEMDAYEDDRRRAQADRERQYRKASFPASPPPRDRRDDREDRYRRPDRRGSMSHYDRERREREMERERTYVSRADPRDKGRALDYGDEDAVGSRPGSVRKRRESDASTAGRRDTKRPRRRTPKPAEEDQALQSGSEEGELAEV